MWHIPRFTTVPTNNNQQQHSTPRAPQKRGFLPVGVSWLGNEAESVNRRAGPSPGAALLVLGSAAGSRHSHASLLAAIPGSCAPSGKDAAITVPYLSQGQVCGASSGSLAPAAPRDGWKSLHFRRVSTTTLMPYDPAGGFSRGEYRPGACWKTKGIAQ